MPWPPITASAIAREAGVDDFLAEATPETKMQLIKREQGEGRLVATSDPNAGSGAYKAGDRVFHIKFGGGSVSSVEGNKLTVAFDQAGEKRVLESFVERV